MERKREKIERIAGEVGQGRHPGRLVGGCWFLVSGMAVKA